MLKGTVAASVALLHAPGVLLLAKSVSCNPSNLRALAVRFPCAQSDIEMRRRAWVLPKDPPPCGLLKQSSEKARSLPESPISGMQADRNKRQISSHVILTKEIAVANIRRVDARKDAKVAAVAQSAATTGGRGLSSR
jgi:hypothetical protein